MPEYTADVAKIYQMRAEACKVLAHPIRLRIIDLLKEGEKTPKELADQMGLDPQALSNSLFALKNSFLIDVRKEGKNAYYSLSDARISQACELMYGVLSDHLKRMTELNLSMVGIDAQDTGARTG